MCSNWCYSFGIDQPYSLSTYQGFYLIFMSTNCLSFIRESLFFQVVFAGFSSESLAQRIIDCKPKIVITCNAVKRGSKVIHLKDIVDAALTESAQNSVSVGEELVKLIFVCYNYFSICVCLVFKNIPSRWHLFTFF